jgi:hypothetical protein
MLAWAGGMASSADRMVDPDTYVVLVEPTSMIEAQTKKLKAEGRLSDDNMPIYRPLVGDLVEVFALHNSDGYEVPQRWMFAKIMRNGAEKTWARAFHNTANYWQPVETAREKDGLTTVTAQDDLTPSVLFYDSFWSEPALAGDGDIVVAVDRRTLVVGHTGSPSQMRVLKKMVRLGADAPDLIAKTLLVRRQGHWATYP